MPVLIPRTRTLAVRLSEEEHAALEKLCLESGARSISDLARNAMRSFVNQAKQESTLLASLSQHFTQVKELEQRLELLAIELASLKSGMQPRVPGDRVAVGGKLQIDSQGPEPAGGKRKPEDHDLELRFMTGDSPPAEDGSIPKSKH